MDKKQEALRLLKQAQDSEAVEELRAILEKASEGDTHGKKIPVRAVQSISLLLGIVLFLGVQAGVVKTDVPDWVYLMFIGGFLSGYDVLALIPLISKLKGGKDG